MTYGFGGGGGGDAAVLVPDEDCFLTLRLTPGVSFRKIRSTSFGKPGHSLEVFSQFKQRGRVSSHCNHN